MKRLVIILSAVAVLLAGIATAVIIIRARAARLALPAEDVTPPPAGTGTKPPASGGSSSSTSKPQGIVPREKDAPPTLSDAAQKDTDGDGLLDGEEAALRTDPKRKDSDNDGLSDLEEVRAYCTDPLKVMTDGKTQDKAWVAAREQEAASAGQRPSFCVE